MLEQGKSEESSSEEEGATFTTTPIPHHTEQLSRGQIENTVSETEPHKKGGVGGRFFMI